MKNIRNGNKTKLIKELTEKATHMYKYSWQPELQIKAYVNGCKDIIDKLKIKDN